MKKRKPILLFFLLLAIVGWIIIYSDGLLKLLFNKKIWVHRVNSIEKLKEVSDKFYGVELDVVFIDSLNHFDVNHPPATSINLSLDSYLSITQNKKDLHYWLDFKNLNTDNQDKALIKLIEICQKYNLNTPHFIVESMNIKLLQPFSNKGFNISYYLHWPGLYTLSKNEFEKEITKIRTNLEQQKTPIYLSSGYHDYEIMKKEFPSYEKLFWLDGEYSESNEFKSRLQLYNILSDDKVKVLLVKQKSVYER